MATDKTPPTAGERRGTFFAKYILSATSASIAECVTFPIDLTKTRMQIQGEKAHGDAKVRGIFRTAADTVRQEGVFALWDGVAPAVMRHIVYTGTRMAMYEWMRDSLLTNADGTSESKDSFPLYLKAVCGMTSGAVSQFIASPMDLIKVQLQIEGRRVLQGLPRRHKGTWDALCSIVSTGGIRALWRGWVPNVQRAALVNLGELATYDTAKRSIILNVGLQDGPIVHALSSGCAGLVAATVSTPADLAKTRYMNQKFDANGRGTMYRSTMDVLVTAARNEGLISLWKGATLNWARMAPWSLTFWLSFEQFRRIAGYDSF